jgi:hypothetical protein
MSSGVRCRLLTLDRDECLRQLHCDRVPRLGPELGACGAVPRSPWSPSFAPPAPPRLAPLCSSASSYFDGVRLLGLVHQRRRLLALPLRTGRVQVPVKPEISRFPCKALPLMPGSLTTPGRAGTRDGAPVRVAFHDFERVGTRGYIRFSRLNGWPMRSPADASPTTWRLPADGLGSTSTATLSSAVDLHHLLSAGLPGAPKFLIIQRRESQPHAARRRQRITSAARFSPRWHRAHGHPHARLARSPTDLQDSVHELRGRGVALRATKQSVGTGAGKAFLDTLAFSPNSRPIYAASGNSRASAPRDRADPDGRLTLRRACAASNTSPTAYRRVLARAVITQLISRKGDCLDNAPMESFFHTPKIERVHHRIYANRTRRSVRAVSVTSRASTNPTSSGLPQSSSCRAIGGLTKSTFRRKINLLDMSEKRLDRQIGLSASQKICGAFIRRA